MFVHILYKLYNLTVKGCIYLSCLNVSSVNILFENLFVFIKEF